MGNITFAGKPVTLAGTPVRAGDAWPDFDAAYAPIAAAA